MFDRLSVMGDGARKALFGAVAFGLVLLAVAAMRGGSKAPATAPVAQRSAQPVVTQPSPEVTAEVVSPEAPDPVDQEAVTTSVEPPLSGTELQAAATVAGKFLTRYNSFRYNENPAVIRQVLSEMSTGERGQGEGSLMAELQLLSGRPLQLIREQQQISVARIRSMDATATARNLATFNAVVRVDTTSKTGRSSRDFTYSVQVFRSGAWKVNDVSLVTAQVGPEDGE